MIKPTRTIAGITALALATGSAPAFAANTKHAGRRNAAAATTQTNGNGETPLTGQTLSDAEAAAIAANPGATANSASTETDSTLTGAAYEVHITKSDGTRATAIEDSAYQVLATNAGATAAAATGMDAAPTGRLR